MVSRPPDDDSLAAFAPALVANLAPVAGLVWLDWAFATLYVFYWVDVVALAVVYAGCAMFAQRTIVTDGRRFLLPGVSEDDDYESKWSDDPRTIDLHPWLPPVYPRNARVVAASLVFSLFVAAVLGSAFAGDVAADGFAMLTSPFLAASLVGVVVSHLHHAHTTYLRPGRYEEMSAHMVLEIPARVLVYLFVAVVAWLFLAVIPTGLLVAAEADALADVVGPVLFLGGWFVLKVSVEWGRFRAERSADPGWFGSWFVPEDPRPDWIVESEQS